MKTMKYNHLKTILAGALLLLSTTCMAQSGKDFRLKLQLSDVTDTLIISQLPFGSYRPERNDTIVTRQGNAERTFRLSEPCYLLLEQPYHGGGMLQSARILAMPGEELSVTGTIESYRMQGSGIYRSIVAAHAVTQDLQDKGRAIFREFQEASKSGDKQVKEAARAKVEAATKTLSAKASAQSLAWIKAHPTEDGAATLFAGLNKEDLNTALTVVDTKVRNGILKGLIDGVVNQQQQRDTFEAAQERIQPGQQAPDFTLKDLSGRDFSLSTLRGQYVLLDFWGSWCFWCIKGMPKMKEYYARYKDRFEIVGVDCNDSETKWKAAVKEHALPWIHVYNGPKDGVSSSYAVNAYPTKILINPDGTINRVVVGESEEFYQYIDNLFKSK